MLRLLKDILNVITYIKNFIQQEKKYLEYKL